MGEIGISVFNMAVRHGRDLNLPVILDGIRAAKTARADVLVLPETCLQGYADFSFPEDSPGRTEQRLFYVEQAEPIPGPTTELIQAELEGSPLLVQIGMAEATQHGNVIYNSVALLDSQGVIGRYRKTHNRGEYPYFDQGDDLPVFDTPIGLVGSLICYDICFPEVVRSLAVQGAELILMSTAWPMVGHTRTGDFYGSRMDLCIQANAFFNQVWIAVSNHCEKGAYSTHTDYYGGSQIVGPTGCAAVATLDEPGLISIRADVHQDVQMSRARDFFGANLLQDHRPDLYARALAGAVGTRGSAT
ncbi:MAG: carbon-nitrogen hydrolase family protein [Candidatus Dormiibacterota bacterium]